MLGILGQPRALAQLQRSLAAGRLASTWLFAGPQGVGKFSLAVELAKTVLCDRPLLDPNNGRLPALPPDFSLTLPCGTCDSCKAIATNSHPDLHIITRQLIRYHDKTGKSKGTTLSIDVIRGEVTGDPAENKEAKIAKRAFRGKGKFFLIDEADLMEPPAQNALLKTLEEPPAQTYLVLITTSPQELLSTIRSRSQVIEFAELSDTVIVPALLNAGLPESDAALMARLARGSLGRALRWTEDLRIIEKKNADAAERAARKAGDSDEEESSNKFTPGGILSWVRDLGAKLDALVSGAGNASDVAMAIQQYAAEFADLQLARDKLASSDRAKRDAIGLFMSIIAEWFADRMRHGLGTPHRTPLPGNTGALDYALVPKLIASARAAEGMIDMNANDKILLAAITTQWEELLRTADGR